MNTAKLKAAAEQATPGRVGDRIDGSGSIKYRCVGADGSLVLLTDHKNNEYGFVGDNGEADELFFRLCTPEAVLELIAALEAAERRNAELTDALKQAVSGYKSCLRTGHERIIELGGECDEPEVMIAGNPDIRQAEKVLAAGINLETGGEA
ncbi:hypothetical protein AB9I09_000961 [Cronobacter sakazakii]